MSQAIAIDNYILIPVMANVNYAHRLSGNVFTTFYRSGEVSVTLPADCSYQLLGYGYHLKQNHIKDITGQPRNGQADMEAYLSRYGLTPQSAFFLQKA